MGAAAAATPQGAIQYRPGTWPQLTDDDLMLIQELGHIGIPRHAAGILLAIHRYGKHQNVTSRWLEHITDARQPEISQALKWLIRDDQITVTKEIASAKKGRPMKTYELVEPADSYIRRKVSWYRQEIDDRLTVLEKTFEDVL
jgi:predicted transcriptional regulator